jgi:beta-lactamase regulating signal transducer with metallopeptidase domain
MNASSWWEALDLFAADYSRYLAQALVHFLWQGCAVAAVYALVTRLLRPAAANTRYLAGVAALLLMAACLPATLLMLPSPRMVAVDVAMQPVAGSVPETSSPKAGEVDAGARGTVPEAMPSDDVRREQSLSAPMATTVASDEVTVQPFASVRFATLLARLTPYASGLYLCGVVLMLLRLAFGLCGGRRLRLACTPITDDTICNLLHDHARRMGLRVVPLLGSCQRASVPLVVGVLRPMILLPASLASGLTLQELEMVLIHELAHIRRFDPAVNVLQRLVEAMLFFHPAVWWVSRRISVERENACDDLVLQNHSGRAKYVGALLRTAELCAAARRSDALGEAALAATGRNGSQLKQRVLRLLGHDRKTTVRLSGAGVVMSTLLVLALLVAPLALRGTAWATEDPKAAEATETLPDEAPPEAAETPQPVSMSAEEFGRLSDAKQRALLRRVFERRMEHAENLYYETDAVFTGYETKGGDSERTVKFRFGRNRRHWVLGASYRTDMGFDPNLTDDEPARGSSLGVNAVEGVGRLTGVSPDGKRPPTGQVTYASDPPDGIPYHYWLSNRKHPHGYVLPDQRLFPYLLKHLNDFEITALDDKVRITFPWQPAWARQPGGTRTYILDPQKGFIPVRCDSRYDDPPGQNRPKWREEHFVVEESRLVSDVWMPIKLTQEIGASTVPNLVNVDQVVVSRIEHGTVRPTDIEVPFTEGMQIVDTIEGVRYVADAEGKPNGPVELAPNWKHQPSAGWAERKAAAARTTAPGMPSMLSRLSPADREMLDRTQREKERRKQRMEAHLKTAQTAPPAAREQRVEAALEILRTYRIKENKAVWVSAIRELVVLGKPALPKLIEELDQTERQETLRALGFVLRGIGDPRAVPALIRAIPRTLQPSGSDYGLRLDDDTELVKFMQEHDNRSGSGRGKSFTYGRPIREIMPALAKITRKAHGWDDLNFVSLKGGASERRLQQRLFLDLARRWADWWSDSWQEYVDTESVAQLDQIEQSLDAYAKSIASERPARTGFPRGVNVEEGGEVFHTMIRSFDESPTQAFLDLDTGQRPCPSQQLLETSTGHEPSKELLEWAEGEGVDLITVKITPPGSDESYHAFKPLGMRLWRVDKSRYETLAKELRNTEELDLPAPWAGPVAQTEVDSGRYDAKLTASFLFMTREGACGVTQFLGRTMPAMSVSAAGGTPPMHQLLKCKFVYEETTKD